MLLALLALALELALALAAAAAAAASSSPPPHSVLYLELEEGLRVVVVVEEDATCCAASVSVTVVGLGGLLLVGDWPGGGEVDRDVRFAMDCVVQFSLGTVSLVFQKKILHTEETEQEVNSGTQQLYRKNKTKCIRHRTRTTKNVHAGAVG